MQLSISVQLIRIGALLFLQGLTPGASHRRQRVQHRPGPSPRPSPGPPPTWAPKAMGRWAYGKMMENMQFWNMEYLFMYIYICQCVYLYEILIDSMSNRECLLILYTS